MNRTGDPLLDESDQADAASQLLGSKRGEAPPIKFQHLTLLDPGNLCPEPRDHDREIAKVKAGSSPVITARVERLGGMGMYLCQELLVPIAEPAEEPSGLLPGQPHASSLRWVGRQVQTRHLHNVSRHHTAPEHQTF